jgi:5-methylcytosine-specific restriction protein A
VSRRSFKGKDRERILAANGGKCHLCDGLIAIGVEAWEVEHVIPYALTQDDSDGNLRPAHKKCHRVKTSVDVTMIAKVERIRAKHFGFAKKRGRWKPRKVA